MMLEKKLESWIDQMRARAIIPLRLALWNGREFDFGPAPQVTVRVPHAAALPYVLHPSLANLGEAYVEGKIEIEGKLADIIAIGHSLAANALHPAGRLRRLFQWSGVQRTSHDKPEDADAIAYHYDVSNDFYKLWLDENMVYSCAYFEQGEETLDAAQIGKIDHILHKIRLAPGQTLLDIGCGWGALVMRAAKNFGARCVGITLSENQYFYAREQIRRAGLADQVEVRLEDYRDAGGRYDRITSVGMFEHVGVRQLPAYFRKIHSLLADDGLAMNHGITTTDEKHVGETFGGGDFMDKYVFPRAELPHIGLTLTAMQEGGLEPLDVENLRRHYARTCGLWAERFENAAAQLEKIAGSKRFRIWRIYLAGCAYAFEHDWMSINQILCTRAGRNASALPWSRRYMYPQTVAVGLDRVRSSPAA